MYAMSAEHACLAMQLSRGRGWTNTWSLSLPSSRPLPEDMAPLTAYRVRGYAANLSALRTCCPARRSHASGRVFQVHGVARVFSVHVSRRVQRNTVNGVGQNNSTEPAPGAQSEGIFAVVHFPARQGPLAQPSELRPATPRAVGPRVPPECRDRHCGSAAGRQAL